jgi:hypothetical protein
MCTCTSRLRILTRYARRSLLPNGSTLGGWVGPCCPILLFERFECFLVDGWVGGMPKIVEKFRGLLGGSRSLSGPSPCVSPRPHQNATTTTTTLNKPPSSGNSELESTGMESPGLTLSRTQVSGPQTVHRKTRLRGNRDPGWHGPPPIQKNPVTA